jgi:hypothetical protein
MAEHMPPAVRCHDGMPGLGAAVEADHRGVSTVGDDGIDGEAFAFIAEIGADDGGRSARFHEIAFC